MNAAGFVAVGIGAALGAWLRWALNVGLSAMSPMLPVGTLVANLAGAFMIGIAVEAFLQHPVFAPEVRLFVITGFLGGLTTFSTFSAESVELLTHQQYGWAMLHISTHLFGSLAMTMLGIAAMRSFGP